jgi:hypothetical protein
VACVQRPNVGDPALRCLVKQGLTGGVETRQIGFGENDQCEQADLRVPGAQLGLALVDLAVRPFEADRDAQVVALTQLELRVHRDGLGGDLSP